MQNPIVRLADKVTARLRRLAFNQPTRSVVESLLEIAYLATLRSEEGRFVRGSLTFADPARPDVDPPYTRRADYPAFTKFQPAETLTVERLVKLARAIDRWSGSVAVYTTRRQKLVAWGVVDQLVHQNVRVHREGVVGASNPGILTVTMDGVGDISAYHGTIFLGGLRAQTLVLQEDDAFRSMTLFDYAYSELEPYAQAIVRILDKKEKDLPEVAARLHDGWTAAISRLCIGLRRYGTGGAFLLTPAPLKHKLQMVHRFSYRRLREAAVLHVLEQQYVRVLMDEQSSLFSRSDTIPTDLALELALAETDAEDRELAITGAIKLVTSLASVDGLVLLTPTLAVVGFGVKILSGPHTMTIYDGAEFERRGVRARTVDPSGFGTRHGSMLRYCAQDHRALGVVVSQDGYVRLIMTIRGNLVLWDNIKLLDHEGYSGKTALRYRRWREARKRDASPFALGYTDLPKTMTQLMKPRKRQWVARSFS